MRSRARFEGVEAGNAGWPCPAPGIVATVRPLRPKRFRALAKGMEKRSGRSGRRGTGGWDWRANDWFARKRWAAHAPWERKADGFYEYERTEMLMGQGLPSD